MNYYSVRTAGFSTIPILLSHEASTIATQQRGCAGTCPAGLNALLLDALVAAEFFQRTCIFSVTQTLNYSMRSSNQFNFKRSSLFFFVCLNMNFETQNQSAQCFNGRQNMLYWIPQLKTKQIIALIIAAGMLDIAQTP